MIVVPGTDAYPKRRLIHLMYVLPLLVYILLQTTQLVSAATPRMKNHGRSTAPSSSALSKTRPGVTSAATAVHGSSTIVKARGHRPRAVYGGRRTRTILPVVGVVTESRDTMSGTDDDDDDSVDIRNENHPSKRKRICNANSEAERNISHGRAGDDSKFDFDQNDGTNATIGRIPDYVTRKRRQPGHRTSLDVARAFFAHIDADPTLLTLERDGPTPPPRRRPVHTTRGRLPTEVAQAAYQNYCAACRDATVSPLPLSAFLQQRSEFFRTGEVFNGMFDD